jgi:hypothetical protein
VDRKSSEIIEGLWIPLNLPQGPPMIMGVYFWKGDRDLKVWGRELVHRVNKLWVRSRVDFSRTFLTAHDLLTDGPVCDRN